MSDPIVQVLQDYLTSSQKGGDPNGAAPQPLQIPISAGGQSNVYTFQDANHAGKLMSDTIKAYEDKVALYNQQIEEHRQQIAQFEQLRSQMDNQPVKPSEPNKLDPQKFAEKFLTDPVAAIAEANKLNPEYQKQREENEQLKTTLAVNDFFQSHPLYRNPEAIRRIDAARAQFGQPLTRQGLEAAMALAQVHFQLPSEAAIVQQFSTGQNGATYQNGVNPQNLAQYPPQHQLQHAQYPPNTQSELNSFLAPPPSPGRQPGAPVNDPIAEQSKIFNQLDLASQKRVLEDLYSKGYRE